MSQQRTFQWYEIEEINSVDSPTFVVYPDRVKANIRTAVEMAGDVSRLRPHVKTHKSKEAARLMMEQGISKFKCATIAEAEMLALCKAKDVLLAYQPVGPKAKRLIELIKYYPETMFSCLVDNMVNATELSQLAVAHQRHIRIYLDLDVGMNRTGLKAEEALSLYTYCSSLPGILPVGLHAYDGHIHHPSLEQRRKDCDESFAPVARLKQKIVAQGFPNPVVIAGGSPTFPIHCKREGVECSPGTFIYWDKNYQSSYPEQPFLLAALVITRVVSVNGSSRVCVDLGHKSIASENALHHRVFFLNAPESIVVSHSEEHLVLQTEQGQRYKPGDVLYGVPFHVCPTAALFERAITVENNKVIGEWKTIARDRLLTY